MDMPIPDSKQQQDAILEKKREECIQNNVTFYENNNLFTKCVSVWDGIMCWPATLPNVTVKLSCPSYIHGFNLQGVATKECLPVIVDGKTSGDWFRDSDGEYWTNYTGCYVTREPLLPSSKTNITLLASYLPALRAISQIGYGISLITLIFAFILLASFKKLRCQRNKLHMHLFVSFMMRAGLKLLKDTLFVGGVGLTGDFEAIVSDDGSSNENSWICKLITSLWQYFIVANYTCLLMEGLYLHNLIFLALFSDTSAITYYVILGWGLPALFVIPWVIVRALYENTFCWTVNANPYYFWIIKFPIVVSILVNFGLFLNIVRVLFLKLTASISEEKRRYRRLAKSTLVLLPLFGVHYALFLGMSYSIDKNETVELVWLICDQLFASSQGFFVALLYCFMNGEVRSEVVKFIEKKTGQKYFNNENNITEKPMSKLFRSGKRQKRGSTAESCTTSLMLSDKFNELNIRRPITQKSVITTTQSHYSYEVKSETILLNREIVAATTNASSSLQEMK